jgi:methyl-accepting chemotaxis protein
VENIIDIKLKKVMAKFDELERRVMHLEKLLSGINERIGESLEKINRQEIRLKVEDLFQKLTPQFENYFTEFFKQIAGVFGQGVSYYNLKLAKEAEFHKEALSQIVAETFKFTDEVAEISKKEQKVSEKTEESLQKILESKKKWQKDMEELHSRTREIPSPVVRGSSNEAGKTEKSESKVFVRADLNYSSPKR